jgi:hypothetical protein
MDIIAAMLAYLTCVTGIVGALAISFYVCVIAPLPTARTFQSAAIVANADGDKSSAIKSNAINTGGIKTGATGTVAAIEHKPVTTMAQNTTDNDGTAKTVALGARQKGPLPHAELRRLAQEQRAKHWAYQQDESFEARFMSYAD